MRKTTLVIWCVIGVLATLLWAASSHVAGLVVVGLLGLFLVLGLLSMRWGC